MATNRSTPLAASPRRTLVLLGAVLLAGCGSSTKPPAASAPQPGVPVVVDAAGGTVAGPGGATVTVPPGATSKPVTIQVRQDATAAPATPDGVRLAGPVFEVTPHGATFDAPVSVRVPFTSVAAGERPVVLKADPGGAWTLLQAFRREGDALVVPVRSFSVFTVGVFLPPLIELPGLTVEVGPGARALLQDASGAWTRPFMVPATVTVTGTPICSANKVPLLAGRIHLSDSTWDMPSGTWAIDPSGRTQVLMPTLPEHTAIAEWVAEGRSTRFCERYELNMDIVCASVNQGTDYLNTTEFFQARVCPQDAHTLGFGVGPLDARVAPGERPAFHVEVLGGPYPGELTETDQWTLEWQRSDDAAKSWRTVAFTHQGDTLYLPHYQDQPVLTLWSQGFYAAQTAEYVGPPASLEDDGAMIRAVATYRRPDGTTDVAFSVFGGIIFVIPGGAAILQSPADALVPAGATAGFAVVVRGSPTPTLQWQSSAPGSGVWTDIPGATSATYDTLPVALADTGTHFRAVASNSLGSATSDPAVLSVSLAQAAPLILTQPVGLSVGAGGSATLAVDATGTAPLAYQWAKDGTDVPGATAAVLSFASVVAADAGLYTVAVSNGVAPAAVSLPARLTVIVAPAIVTQPASVTVSAGQTATFGVTATGARTLSYQWLRDGVAIPSATGPLYATPPTVSADSGAVFSVAIWNTAGAVVSDGAVLTVVVQPPPAVASVTPDRGPTSGGTPIALAGTGFQSGATVTVGGAPATAVTFLSATSLTAVTPAGPAGSASLVVKNPDGQTATGAFTYELVTLSVLSTSPVGTNVQASTAAVGGTFSSPLDCAPVTGASLQVFEGATQVPGTVSCSGSVLTFQPSPGLPTNTTLRGHVDPAVRSLAGATLGAAFDWTFGTAPWTRQLGSSAQDQTNAVAVDPAGNVFAVGDTFGSLDGSLLGVIDAFAVKYSASGAKLWTRHVGVPGAVTQGRGAAADAAGNLYVVGSTSGNLDGVTSAGGSDAFVVKYDAAGVRQWTRLLGTTQGEVAHAAATDASGNVYVVGFTGGGLDGNTSAGLDDLFLAKFDGAGTKLWTRQLGTSQPDVARAVAVDGAGNVYVAGTTAGGLDGNTAAGTSATVDGFLVKYDGAGVKLWTRQLGTSVDDWTNGVAADTAGNAYVAGQTYGSLDGNTNAGPSGTSDGFLVKYDAAGVKQWTRQLGSAATDGLNAVAVDGSGAVFVAGGTNGAIEAGSTNTGGPNLLVARYDAAGTLTWLHQRGSGAATNDNATGLAADAFGGLFLGGITSGALDGNASAGGFDAYLVKYGVDGTPR